MEGIHIPSNEDGRQVFQFFLGKYDAPAFVRRARDVEGSWRTLLEECRRLREPLLDLVRLRLGTLHALLGGNWQLLSAMVESSRDLDILHRLHDELHPQLRIPVSPTSQANVQRSALRELVESIERFNRLWPRTLQSYNYEPINKIRDGYNRYYLLEKECAVGAARLSRQEFRRLAMVAPEMVLAELPLLPVPKVKA